ncbi:hypothetical protein ACL6C3_11670 [Capilliphycus salinus ALCB114379]|uniref:hypothetical protein n=1 Tax=Capilliphycus salinus TaxID=2768948 RepID=UPI0039A74EF1
MSNTSKLDEIVEKLEKDVNLIRIKKVMICACRGKWENNQNNLNNFAIKDLVQELYWKTQTPNNLYNILDRILSKINKKSEYTLIMNTIIHQIGPLYLENQSESLNQDVTENLSNFTQSDPSQPLEETASYPNINSVSNVPDLFDIRWRILQYTNPLRVKLLLFSTLEREFTFNNQDWSQLKLHTLDDLLRQLLRNFPSFSGLKSNLTKMANYLEHPDENLQAVTIILESLKAIYAKKSETNSSNLSVNINQNTNAINSETVNQISKNSHPKPPSSNRTHLNSSFNSPKTLSNPADSFLNEKLSQTQSNLISTNLKTEELANLNSQLESQVNQIVNKSIKKTIYPINQTWDELQNLLDLCFKNLPPSERWELKKFALQELLNVIRSKVNELQDSLNQLETTELQSWSTVDLSQQKTMDLARQGNAKAIASLINQSLKSRGIHTQVKSQNGCLHVVLTAEPIPDSESTASFIHNKLIFLKIQSIQTIKIYGRKTGTKSIAWTQEYNYN